ncbi:hypothetical protein HRB15_002228 [Salmonella enterica]|nr:hypothetical protein [Salmonella enterica]
MGVKIDRKLNFVSTITRDDGSLVYLHVVPFPYEVVEENCVLLGNLFNNFFSLVGSVGAPRVAAMMLRKIIKARQEAGDLQPGTPNIVDEIQRLTTVIWNDNGSVIQQILPTFYVNRLQQQFSKYFSSLQIALADVDPPVYNISAITNSGSKIAAQVYV